MNVTLVSDVYFLSIEHLNVPTRIYNIHVHAVVGSDKKLGKYEGKLLSNSHTKEHLIVKDLVILTGRSDSLEVPVEVPTVRVRLLQCVRLLLH